MYQVILYILCLSQIQYHNANGKAKTVQRARSNRHQVNNGHTLLIRACPSNQAGLKQPQPFEPLYLP